MKFVDKIEINIKAGNGGPGCSSFRREKYVPKGGPDGGNGGHGGNIIIQATTSLQTLMDLKPKKIYKAPSGDQGRSRNQTGKDGEDKIIFVPIGTIIFDVNNNKIADLCDETPFIAAKGGKGGKGNQEFATPTNRTPRYAQTGLPGEEHEIILELRLIAKVGLIGLPNAGKSTLLKRLTNANPKIAAYPFTTKYPNLGVLRHFDQEIIIADIPGLIEGASKGAGLGHDFLRHIDRTSILVHLIEIPIENPQKCIDNYKIIQNELKTSPYSLIQKKQIVVLNKIDIIKKDDLSSIEKSFEESGIKTLSISASSGIGIEKLIKTIYEVYSCQKDTC